MTVHSLRHLGAELYYAASGEVRETQIFLDHARLDTTSIYLQQLTGEQHRHWQAMANKLGVQRVSSLYWVSRSITSSG